MIFWVNFSRSVANWVSFGGMSGIFCMNGSRTSSTWFADAGVLHGQGVQRPDRTGQLQRHFLDGVDHLRVILDHLADLVERTG